MNLTQRVYDQACLMLPELVAENQSVLEAVCRGAVVSLEAKLKNNIAVKDCLDDFVMAASLYAVAAMSEVGQMSQLEQVTAGDLTVRKANGSVAANGLRAQADMLMAPYTKTAVAFLGV